MNEEVKGIGYGVSRLSANHSRNRFVEDDDKNKMIFSTFLRCSDKKTYAFSICESLNDAYFINFLWEEYIFLLFFFFYFILSRQNIENGGVFHTARRNNLLFYWLLFRFWIYIGFKSTPVDSKFVGWQLSWAIGDFYLHDTIDLSNNCLFDKN